MVANVGPEIAKTAKCATLTKMCQNYQKMCEAQKVPKSPKTALSGLAIKVPEGVCVRVFCECQSVNLRLRQAQEPCPALPSLIQLTPARSGPRSLAQLPKGPGKVPSIQGASQRLQGPGVLLSAQRCVQAQAQEKCYSNP